MSVLINEAYANPSNSLWASASSAIVGKNALPSSLTSGTTSLTGGITTIATIPLNGTYTLASGEGYLYFPTITSAGGGATTISVWIAGTGSVAIDPSKVVSYVSASITNGSPLVVDLSKLRYYNASGFSSLVLYIQSSGGNSQCSIGGSIVCPETTWSGTASTSSLTSVGTTSGTAAVSSFITCWVV